MQYVLNYKPGATHLLRHAMWILRSKCMTQPLAVSVPKEFTRKLMIEFERSYGELEDIEAQVEDRLTVMRSDGKKEHKLGRIEDLQVYDNTEIDYIAGITTDFTFNIMFGFQTVVMNVTKNAVPFVKFI